MQNKVNSNDDNFTANLKALCQIYSISGHEQELLNFIISKLPPNCCHKFDNLSNLVVEKNSGVSKQNKIMLISPVDEIGLIINQIEPDGSLKFLNIGNVNPCALIGSIIKIKNYNAVIGAKPPHLQTESDKNKEPSIENMFIDLGLENQKQAEEKIKLGEVATFKASFLEFGNGKVSSKSINSKIGCSILLNLLQSFNECSFFCAFLTKSEVSSAGTTTIANLVKPDIAIILNSYEEICCKKTSSDRIQKSFRLNLNPATNKPVFDCATQTAKINNFNFDVKINNKLTEIEKLIMQAGRGVKTLNLAVPCRLINSSCSNFLLNHAKQTEAFLKKLIPNLTKLT